VRHLVVLLVAAGCGSHGTTVASDAPAEVAPPDAGYPACREFDGPGMTLPVHVTGALSGADVTSPMQCPGDAPYGLESAGPDSVIRIERLAIGATYVVHLRSASDLAFYVVTGCSTPTGPSQAECLLFEDANTGGDEVGTFVATTATAYVVVDYYAPSTPADPSFTLDVYLQTCTSAAQCGGAYPVCLDGTCVACGTDFDCTDASASRCDGTTSTCVAGTDACLADDPGEPANDGPAGAAVLAVDGAGNASITGEICSDPSYEADYVAFDVAAVGEVWDLALAWTGSADLDLEIYDATGTAVGLSYWDHPESARLTYLTPGRYYAKITDFASTANPSPVPYTLSVHATSDAGCASDADCAAEYRNQIYRGSCQAGACVAIDGGGAIAEGGACDSESDCAPGLQCPSFFFVANADARDVCARNCIHDTDCAALGSSYVCTTYLQSNFCVQKCTSDVQCPTAIEIEPPVPPWFRLSCDIASGRCLP
jgi:hypothetical protein